MTNTSNEKGRSNRHGSPKLRPGQNSDPSSAVYTRRLECRTVATGRFGQRHHIRDLPAIVGGSASVDSATLLGDDVLWSPVANTLHDPVDLQVSLVPV